MALSDGLAGELDEGVIRISNTLWYIDVADDQIDTDFLSQRWYDETLLRDPRCCGLGCGGVRPQFWGTAVNIEVVREPRGCLQVAPMANVLSSELARSLRPVLHSAVFGNCTIANSGTVLESHVSVYTPSSKAAILVGPPGTRYRYCKWCGLQHITRQIADMSKLELVIGARAFKGAIQVLGHYGFAVNDITHDAIWRTQSRYLSSVRMKVRVVDKG